jgi:hypothetical protein
MKISRMIWAWQRKHFSRSMWTVDGGIWPRLRIVRDATPYDFTIGGMLSKGFVIPSTLTTKAK